MIYLDANGDQNDLVNFNYFTTFIDHGNIAEVLKIRHDYIRSKFRLYDVIKSLVCQYFLKASNGLLSTLGNKFCGLKTLPR